MTSTGVDVMTVEEAIGELESPSGTLLDQAGPVHGFEPVIIKIERDHKFEKKAKAKHVCICGEHRLHPAHGPFSYREIDGGQSSWPYRNAKRLWEPLYLEHLAAAGMPMGCSCIRVEARIVFPDRIGRDQGNWRFPVEKFLGDALQTGGYINNDRFYPVVEYEFDRFEGVYEKGVMRLELMLLPS